MWDDITFLPFQPKLKINKSHRARTFKGLRNNVYQIFCKYFFPFNRLPFKVTSFCFCYGVVGISYIFWILNGELLNGYKISVILYE